MEALKILMRRKELEMRLKQLEDKLNKQNIPPLVVHIPVIKPNPQYDDFHGQWRGSTGNSNHSDEDSN